VSCPPHRLRVFIHVRTTMALMTPAPDQNVPRRNPDRRDEVPFRARSNGSKAESTSSLRNKPLERRGGHRQSTEVSLKIVTAGVLEEGALRLGFDALRDHP
jgi:hypothetical protein